MRRRAPKKPGPKLNRDWVGLRVRLRREASNAYGVLPAGTEGVIKHYSSGRPRIEFMSDECPHCKVRIRISGMSRFDFDILTPKEDWPDTRGKGRHYEERRW